MKQKTGILGGSFNPIHIGHLALANYLCEFSGLDEVWFMVSPLNPLKQQEDLIGDKERLELTRLATEGYNKFKVSDIEFQLPRPSYTINTLTALRSSYPEREFHLIIGADNWIQFDKWKEYERIISENKLLIYPRPGYLIETSTLPDHVKTVDTPLLDISSTFIREAIKQKKDVRYFLHSAVYSYIKEKGFYL